MSSVMISPNTFWNTFWSRGSRMPDSMPTKTVEASETPLELAPGLSRRLRNRLLIKREDLQPVFSFKLRGAYNKMAGLPRARLARGVIAASAGNHAQGVALAAQRLGCRAVIVMPVTTPRIKVDAVVGRGAEVVLVGDSYDEAYRHAKVLERRR